jgi:hypothetical protein
VDGPFLIAVRAEALAVDLASSVPRAALPEHRVPVAPCIPRAPSLAVDRPGRAPALASAPVRERVPALASAPVPAARLDSFRLLVMHRARSVPAASNAAAASNIRRPRKAR